MDKKDLFEPYKGEEEFIFVSYHHGDSEKVYDIINALHHKGYRIWHDRDIPMSNEWSNELVERIENSSIVLCFLSSAYYESDCMDELRFAMNEGRPIIPIMLEDEQMPSKINLFLTRIKKIYLSRFNSVKEFVDQLSEGATKYLDPCRKANTDQTTQE